MSNYLFDLIAKSFNLIDTVQPLVLSVFEPLPESNLDWEPSIATDSTELETTSEAEKFLNFEIARSPVTIGQISEEITNSLLTNLTSTPVQFSQQILKSIPNLVQKPNLELSSNWPFLDSTLTQISTDNQQFTSNPEQKTSTTPPNLILAPLLQKQLTKINPVASSVQPSKIVNLQRLITPNFVESEILSPTGNQAVLNPNIKSILVPQTKTYLANNLVSVHNTESNTSLSNPIFEQRQIAPKSFSQQLITINRLGLSLQSPLKSDLHRYFTENPTKPVIFSFTPQEKTFSLPNLNPTIFKTAIAKENNTPVSKLVGEKSRQITTKSLNNQSIEINQLASPNSLPKVLYLRESLPQIQAKTSTILSNPSILKPGKSATENLHKQSTQINPVFTHSQLPQSESSENFHAQFQSESTAMSTTGNSSRGYTNAYASDISQVWPLTPVLAVETSTPSSPVIQPQEQLVSELLQKRFLQTENISSSEIFLSQIIEQPTAIAPAITQVLPLTPVATIDTSHSALSSVIQPQVKHEAIPSLRDATRSLLPRRGTVSSANASTIDSILANSHKQSLIPTIATETIAEPQEKLTSKGLLRNKLSILWGGQHERPKYGMGVLTRPTRKSGMFFYLEVPNVPENQQRFVHKNLSSMQPILADASSKISSLQTNSFTAPFLNNLPSSVASQPTTQLTAINSDIISTPALYPSTAENNTQLQVNFSDFQLSDFRGEKASTQEVGLKNYNSSDRQHIPIQKISVVEQWDELVNYAHHPANIQRQQINPNEGILTSPVENSILPENASPNLFMFADRFKDRQHIPIQKISVVEQWDELVNYAHHPANMQRQQINPNEGILTSPVENLILSQNASPNLLMSADRFKYRQHIDIQKIGVVEQWDELRQGGGEMNLNYAYHTANMEPQKINRNEGILTSPVENSILPQNTSPNLSMSADRGRDGVKALYFTQLEESDLRPLSEPINELTVKNLSVIATSNKKLQKRWRSPSQTSPPKYDASPPIQVTIGRLEIRSAAPAPPPPRPKPRTATSVMSLNEYLQRRTRRR